MMEPEYPLPPELAADDGEWLDEVVDEALELADAAAMDVSAAATALADGQPRRWTVTDLGSAEWAMRHVVAAETELDQLGRQAAEWSERIQRWFEKASRPLEAKVAFMCAHLERYALMQRAEDERKKRVALPSGVVQTTAKAPRLIVRDDAAAMAWAREHYPEAVVTKTTEALSLSTLKRQVKPVQMLTEAELVLSCGCAPMRIERNGGLSLPALGTELPCDTHGAALLGRVDVVATRWVLTKDVPGCDVDPGGVSAKVVRS